MSVKAQSAVSASLVDEAAHWLALQHSSTFTASDRKRLEQWLAQSPAHRQVWAQAQALADKFSTVPSAVGMAVLGRPRGQRNHRRAVLMGAAGTVIAAPLALWLGLRLPMWWGEWNADLRTATGEQRDVQLPDGSRLVLNTASAISIKFDSKQRLIEQHSGEILIESAPGSAADPRPLLVRNAHGLMQPVGTRFVVRQTAEQTRLSVLEGAVDVWPGLHTASRRVNAGEQLSFTATSAGEIMPVTADVAAWQQGYIHADHMRLDDFVAELGRYRPGVLRCDPEVAQLRVNGIFQIKDTDKVLQLLTSTLPITQRRRSAYWVVLAGKS